MNKTQGELQNICEDSTTVSRRLKFQSTSRTGIKNSSHVAHTYVNSSEVISKRRTENHGIQLNDNESEGARTPIK